MKIQLHSLKRFVKKVLFKINYGQYTGYLEFLKDIFFAKLKFSLTIKISKFKKILTTGDHPEPLWWTLKEVILYNYGEE